MGRRTPEDGRLDWELPAQTLHNLVRAVSDPWPGAFRLRRSEQVYRLGNPAFATICQLAKTGHRVLSIAPLIVACQDGALEIVTGQTERGVWHAGRSAGAGAGPGVRAVISSKPVVAIKRRTRC
ncbi:hypothetical protein LNP74_10895 [Klebsiella pneumoniae subsp. pneumoniae]|nr:hypothetical protein [Klebsiella pneumoniae subsp. pneumoniae]